MRVGLFYTILGMGVLVAIFVARPLFGEAAALVVLATAYFLTFFQAHYEAWIRGRIDLLPAVGAALVPYGLLFLYTLSGVTNRVAIFTLAQWGMIILLVLCSFSYLFAKDWDSRIRRWLGRG
ncbi:hypothetical protein COV28_01200 [candidate division WWE3 bacterium CG10_big_fil_rev_8_21_14_0_10_48_23]|uniref:Uncharacterized protein n=1 Tax=candidate division WWE3 bacterium CG_4_9_14_0_2_um_filter_48_10 TaxID=1975078 RepID=A0A2M8EI99_UNCKA|nr:MAG: hypothetical protein CO059_02645 [candidate division WWE3 bacterium CG_4_9_14_0_2_um_filter_48_10]PJE52025.1 MAG: hypothetical protein COV28_01200 [candidate division WWE3 bacterium CG10_big_fil_rev_8_21_14_0_10_48_23]